MLLKKCEAHFVSFFWLVGPLWWSCHLKFIVSLFSFLYGNLTKDDLLHCIVALIKKWQRELITIISSLFTHLIFYDRWSEHKQWIFLFQWSSSLPHKPTFFLQSSCNSYFWPAQHGRLILFNELQARASFW